MKNLMISTAVMAVLAVPALAQDTAAPSPFMADAIPGQVHASDLIGARIYAVEGTIEADGYAGLQDNWDDIGSVGDLVVSRDGQVEAVLVDIGGFLGMGAREVAVDMSALRFVPDNATENDPDDWFLVLNADRTMLEGAPEWQMTMAPEGTTAGAPMTVPADSVAAEAPAADDPVTAVTDGTAMREPIQREGFAAVERTQLTSEMLTGATAYDAEENNVGSVSNLVLTEAGEVTEVVIDVGGFLGIGAKPVSLSLDQIDILRDTDGDTIRVYVPMTKEQLTELPAFES
ncbi:MAG: PRC-barrel domain-containing protein [Paracoccaceae bacterium]|nr:MAG: PRC-barrel domain-containing protein [Paracoccaceae bacterium]